MQRILWARIIQHHFLLTIDETIILPNAVRAQPIMVAGGGTTGDILPFPY